MRKLKRRMFAASLSMYVVAGGPLPGAPPAEPAPIRDNSFLLEEAYNQEAGVVQHISSFSRDRESGEWVFTFIQEWPVASEKHQLSYAVPIIRPEEENGGGTGMGDMAINYRFQALGGSYGKTAFAPRLSLLLPTGDEREARGAGGTGVQANLPLSLQLSESFAVHSNAGATIIESARNAEGDRARVAGVNLGQSVIWLARPRLNLMLEAAWSRLEEVVGQHETSPADSFFLGPGVRGAINLRSGLQVVPGLALPIGLGPSNGEGALFLYLSFEHPFARRRVSGGRVQTGGT